MLLQTYGFIETIRDLQITNHRNVFCSEIRQCVAGLDDNHFPSKTVLHLDYQTLHQLAAALAAVLSSDWRELFNVDVLTKRFVKKERNSKTIHGDKAIPGSVLFNRTNRQFVWSVCPFPKLSLRAVCRTLKHLFFTTTIRRFLLQRIDKKGIHAACTVGFVLHSISVFHGVPPSNSQEL